jgi:hypothetical protein
MKKISQILFLLFFANANAQLGDRDGNGMTYGQRYIQNIEDNNRKPNTPLSGSGDAYRREALARPNTGLTEEQLEGVRIYREQEAARLKKESDISSAQWNFESRYYNYFKTSGIDPYDSTTLSKNSVNKSSNTENESGFRESLEKVSCVNAFKINLNTYNYDQLTSLIYQYTDLHNTAFESCAKLKEKFPDKKFENDILFVKIALKYYKNSVGYGLALSYPYKDSKYGKEDQDNKRKIDDLYRSIYRSYPDEVEQLLINPENNNNDIYTLATLFSLEDNKPKKDISPLDIYNKKLKCNKECERLRNLFKSIPNKNVINIYYGDRVLNSFEKTDFEGRIAFAKFHSIPPIETVPGYDRFRQYDTNSYYYSYKSNGKHSDFFKKEYPDGYKMLLKLVEMEDNDALLLYGTRIYLGLEEVKQEDFHLWLEKAIEKGNKNAEQLLYNWYTRYHQN